MYEVLKQIAKQLSTIVFNDNILKYGGNNYCPMRELVNSNKQYILYSEKLDYVKDKSFFINRMHDIIVGFYCKSAGHIKVIIGGVTYTSMNVNAGQFIYAIDDESIIPLVTLRFQEVKIEYSDNINIVYAIVNTNIRKDLCFSGAWTSRTKYGDYILYKNGLSNIVETMNDDYGKELYDFGIMLPNMRHIPIIFDCFLTKSYIHKNILPYLTKEQLESTPKLYNIPEQLKIEKLFEGTPLEYFKIIGNKMTIGCSQNGMHEHSDESYQGGEYSLLIYLTTVTKGGETVFDYESIKPKAGQAVLIHNRAKHYANPVISSESKYIIAVEVSP